MLLSCAIFRIRLKVQKPTLRNKTPGLCPLNAISSINTNYMQYIFFLGRLPAVSLAEIQAMLEKYKIEYKVVLTGDAFCLLDLQEALHVRDFFVQMGGTRKIAQVLESADEAQVRERIADLLKKAFAEKPGKKSIGYSVYSTRKLPKDKEEARLRSYQDLFSKLKRDELAENSVRLVYPNAGETELSTATIFNNRLAAPKNFELDILHAGSRIILGKTLIVQDIESYGMRDYEKPGRDAKIGMMPPKLAQVMINLAQTREGNLIFDPFCGTAYDELKAGTDVKINQANLDKR
jgi:tRNA G10  N-methylase Trm11